MSRRIGTHQKTDFSQTRFRTAALVGLLFAVATLIQGQSQTKPSDVFFYDPAHPDQRGAPYNIGTSFAPKNQKPAASIVAKGVVLRGWLEEGWDTPGFLVFPNAKFEDACKDGQPPPPCNTRFLGYEDVHFELTLDYDFINSTYGQNGGVLNGAVIHGNPIDSKTTAIPVAVRGNGTPSGIGINSFLLTYNNARSLPLAIHMELNAWHARGSQQCSYILDQRVGCDAYENYAARGPAPAGWVEREFDYASSLPAVAADNWWPFDPVDPDGSQSIGTGVVGQRPGPDYSQYQSCTQSCEDNCPDNLRTSKPSATCVNSCTKRCKKDFPHAFTNVIGTVTVPNYLKKGDYVEVQGALWQDSAHDAGTFWQNLTGSAPPPSCWGKPLSFHNQEGWLEIHPVDSIRRIIPAPGPPPYEDLLGSAKAGVKRIIGVSLCSDEQGAAAGQSWAVCPEQNYGGDIPPRTPYPLVPHVLELIDDRFTDTNISGRIAHGASVVGDCAKVGASWAAGLQWAHYKASYVVWWTPGPATITGKTASTTSSDTNLTLQNLQVQLPLSASVCPTVDSKSCLPTGKVRPPGSPLMDIVTVSSGGKPVPVAGATVSVSGQQTYTAVTNASGVAVITHLPCFAPGSQVSQVGKPAPVRTPVPCGATVSKPGYQSVGMTLP